MTASGADALRETIELSDYRHGFAAIYAELRDASGAVPPGAAAWRRWRERRNKLFATHPQSPIPPVERASFSGLPFFDYDTAWRFEWRWRRCPTPPRTGAAAAASLRHRRRATGGRGRRPSRHARRTRRPACSTASE